jgi:hypothetical protein
MYITITPHENTARSKCFSRLSAVAVMAAMPLRNTAPSSAPEGKERGQTQGGNANDGEAFKRKGKSIQEEWQVVRAGSHMVDNVYWMNCHFC